MPAATMSSAEACDRLGIRPQTLYAYVSRGLLTPRKVGRRSRFPVSQVEALAQRTARGRRPGRFEINIETGVTLLDPRGRLFYRGVDATALAGDWSYERVAAWLWDGEDRGEPQVPWAADAEAVEAARGAQLALPAGVALGPRLRLALAAMAAVGGERPAPPTLVATLVESLPVLGAERGGSIAERLWPRLTAHRPTTEAIRALDAALVLLADHELAASALAARVAASTWAGPHEVVLAGLATLAGPLHGGADEPVRVLLADAARRGAANAIDDALEVTRRLPGVGHTVYQTLDPRCDALLPFVRTAVPARAALVDGVASAMQERTGTFLNVDFALGALVHVTKMVPEAGRTIFAVARIAGWLAQAAEESAHRLRFRPRAVYIGARLE